MTDSPLSASKKCPHCQQWSTWQQQPDDHCEHCGKLLDPQAYQSAHARAELAKQESPIKLLEIKPDDGAVLRFLKTVGRGGQLAFGAILAAIVWIVTAVAG